MRSHIARGVAVASVLAMAATLAACSGGGASGDEVRLNYQTWRLADPGAIGKLNSDWVNEFNASQSKITVVGQGVPQDKNTDTLLNKVLAGSPPDVVAVSAADVPQLAKYMLPLEERYAKGGASFKDGFADGALQLASWDGKLYGVPIELATTEGLYYNKQILAKAGVDIDQATSSWDAFSDALGKIKAAGADANGIVMAGADASRVDYLWAWFAAAGAPLQSEKDLQQKLCSAQGKEAFTYVTDLFSKNGYGPSPVDIDFNQFTSVYAGGKTAFSQGGSWMNGLYVAANPALKDALGVTHMPLYKEGAKPAVILDSLVLMIPKDSKHPDQAWSFIKFLTTPKKQLQDALQTGFLPTIKSVADDPKLKADPLLSLYSKLAVDDGISRPRTTHLAEVKQAIWEQWQKALLGKTDAASALQAACSTIEKDLK